MLRFNFVFESLLILAIMATLMATEEKANKETDTIYQHDHKKSTVHKYHDVCPVTAKNNDDLQTDCKSWLASIEEDYLNKGYSLQILHKRPKFRSQVMCKYLSGNEFKHLTERTAYRSLDLLNSERIKEKLDMDIRVKLEELAHHEAKEEIENISKEMSKRLNEVEQWLKKNEESYLVELKNLVRKQGGLLPITAVAQTERLTRAPLRISLCLLIKMEFAQRLHLIPYSTQKQEKLHLPAHGLQNLGWKKRRLGCAF